MGGARRSETRRLLGPTLLAAIAAVTLSGCSGDDDPDATTTNSAGTTFTATTETTLGAEQVQQVMATWVPGPTPGPPAVVEGAVDACSLLTTAEIAETTGIAEVEDAAGTGTGANECLWLLPNKPPAQSSVSVLVYAFADSAGAADYFAQLKGVWPEIILRQPDLGEEAFFFSLGRDSTGQIQSLWVRKGPYLVKVFAFEYDWSVALAETAIARLEV